MSIIKYIIRSKKKYWNQGSNPFNEIQGWNPFHKVKASKPFMKSISNPFYKTKVRVLLIKSSLFFSFNLAKLWNLILKLRFKPNSWSQSSNPVLEAKVRTTFERRRSLNIFLRVYGHAPHGRKVKRPGVKRPESCVGEARHLAVDGKHRPDGDSCLGSYYYFPFLWAVLEGKGKGHFLEARSLKYRRKKR